MKDQAYKVLALHTLYHDMIQNDADPDEAFEVEWDFGQAAFDLARDVALDNPLGLHTRLAEVFQYAERRQLCVHEAIVELVNTALSHPGLLIGTKNTEV
jgi:hypothetical protein